MQSLYMLQLKMSCKGLQKDLNINITNELTVELHISISIKRNLVFWKKYKKINFFTYFLKKKIIIGYD